MKTVINVLATVGLIFLTISMVANIKRQAEILNDAAKKNYNMEKKWEELQAENEKLTKLVEEATSSAYIEVAMRDKLGVGSEDDYWIIMPKRLENIDLSPKISESEEKPVWLQWWGLFTR